MSNIKTRYIIIALVISLLLLGNLIFFVFRKVNQKNEAPVIFEGYTPIVMEQMQKNHPEISEEQLMFYIQTAKSWTVKPCRWRADEDYCVLAFALLNRSYMFCGEAGDYKVQLECSYALLPEVASHEVAKCNLLERDESKVQCLFNIFNIFKEQSDCAVINDAQSADICREVILIRQAKDNQNESFCLSIKNELLNSYCYRTIRSSKGKIFNCESLPVAHAVWNTVSSYEQVWQNNKWFPADDSVIEYNEIPSLTSCRFKCAENFTWAGNSCQCGGDFHQEGEECLVSSRTAKCAPDKPVNTDWTTASEYKQEWNQENKKWEPVFKTAYGESDTGAPCRYQCVQHSTYDPASGQCKSETRTKACDPMPNLAEWNGPIEYLQVWNAVSSSWQPILATEYSKTAGNCKFICTGILVWDGDSCEVP